MFYLRSGSAPDTQAVAEIGVSPSGSQTTLPFLRSPLNGRYNMLMDLCLCHIEENAHCAVLLGQFFRGTQQAVQLLAFSLGKALGPHNSHQLGAQLRT